MKRIGILLLAGVAAGLAGCETLTADDAFDQDQPAPVAPTTFRGLSLTPRAYLDGDDSHLEKMLAGFDRTF